MRDLTRNQNVTGIMEAMTHAIGAAGQIVTTVNAEKFRHLQEQLARLIDRQGFCIEQRGDSSYFLSEKTVDVSTQRAELAGYVTELIGLLGPEWESRPNGLIKSVWNARKFNALLNNPDATFQQLTRCVRHCKKYIGWLKDRNYQSRIIDATGCTPADAILIEAKLKYGFYDKNIESWSNRQFRKNAKVGFAQIMIARWPKTFAPANHRSQPVPPAKPISKRARKQKAQL